MTRKIIRIDEEKCNGCELCAKGCPEGALKMIDGKAKLVAELYCDGLGACIGQCPVGAIAIEEREGASGGALGVEAYVNIVLMAILLCNNQMKLT